MNRTHLPAVLAALLLALAGCGSGDAGGGVASAGGTQTSSAGAAEEISAEEWAFQFVECMRDNGIDLPDPEPDGNGGPGLGLADAGIDPGSPEFQQAMEACRDLLPNGGERLADNPELTEQLRELAECMRDNGIDMPDPEPGGGLGLGNADIDRNSPEFQQALEACEDKRPRRGNG